MALAGQSGVWWGLIGLGGAALIGLGDAALTFALQLQAHLAPMLGRLQVAHVLRRRLLKRLQSGPRRSSAAEPGVARGAVQSVCLVGCAHSLLRACRHAGASTAARCGRRCVAGWPCQRAAAFNTPWYCPGARRLAWLGAAGACRRCRVRALPPSAPGPACRPRF